MDPAIRGVEIWQAIILKLSCCVSVYECPETKDYIQQTIESNKWLSTAELSKKVEAEGANEDRIDLACRLWTGLETPLNHRGAVELLLAVCATPVRDTRNGARFRATQARARALLAWMLWSVLDLDASDDQRTLTALRLAANFAEEAIALGLPSFACMQVAVALDAARRRAGADGTDVLAEFGALRALHDRLLLAPIECWMPFATGCRPTRVGAGVRVCAGRGCDIQETPQWPFTLCCGGPCPPERKPWYCGRACSWSGWQAHAPLCRADKAKGRRVDDGANSDDDAERARKGMMLSLERREADDAKSEAYFAEITKATKDVRSITTLGWDTKALLEDFIIAARNAEIMKTRAKLQPILDFYP